MRIDPSRRRPRRDGRTVNVMILVMSATFGTSVFAEPTRETALELTYVANEGVMLRAGDVGVLIDALFRDGVQGYARMASDKREAMEQAEAPFDSIRAVLVTHRHADHFDPLAVVRHMIANPKATLVSSTQVVESVKDAAPNDYAGFAERVKAMKADDADRIDVEASGINVEVIRLTHGSGRFAQTWNLGFVVHLAGWRVLHIGDAALLPQTFDPLATYAKGVDVALIPYWFLQSRKGADFIRETLKPGHLFAIHVPPAEAEDITTSVKGGFPQAVVLTESLASKVFQPKVGRE